MSIKYGDTKMKLPGYDVIEHSWDTAPADLWPFIQAWITEERIARSAYINGVN